MSEVTGCPRPADPSAPRKRAPSPGQGRAGAGAPKFTKVGDSGATDTGETLDSSRNCEGESREEIGGGSAGSGDLKTHREADGALPADSAAPAGHDAATAGHKLQVPGGTKLQGSGDHKVQGSGDHKVQKSGDHKVQGSGDHKLQGTGGKKLQGSGDHMVQKSGDHKVQGSGDHKVQGSGDHKVQGSGDHKVQGSGDPKVQGSGDHKVQGSGDHKVQGSGDHKLQGSKPTPTPADKCDSAAAIAAAEALASLTGGDGEDSRETPCSSEKKEKPVKHGSKYRQQRGAGGGGHQSSSKVSSKTQAAAADSSTSVHSTDKKEEGEVGADAPQVPDEGDESVSGSGSSSTPSSSFPSENEDNDDGECAIVSVKMAPEIRQSVALLAQVQMRLEALEKRSARLHQRLEQKIGRQRRPQLDQRSSITKTIPGFWVTALLNHPHLSAHIDETDEDALSYMTDLEIESFKNNKLGYRIRFHFRRNPYFQNNIIMKELHLGMGGSPMSFSNPILWHRGHNLTAHSEPRKSSRGVYETFFSWFSDHSNPGQDDVAQILKDDLYRDPLRYYLTPLWEPRENGSGTEARAADNSNGDECVVISDSDDEPGEEPVVAKHGPSREPREEEEEEEDEEGEEDDDDRGASADESQEEEEEEEEDGDDGGGGGGGGEEIVIDGSDDSDQEEDEEDEA
ncbi:testis specific protein Y-linked [Cololabis saira]|uniref:testis specific protein Y-linked n=1 Tax=Cololabis saira TaxID=129043 RepID=UPI002AD37035|nr:testis specific protein Y-linked [Cololabis saira]